jgi:hypothetical protein
MHQRPTPSLPTLPCAVAEARLSDVVAPFRPCRARTRARRCWATAVPTARSGCRPCAPLLAVWCPTSPPSPLPHHTGFKTGVAPSPPPFLLLEHDSSDACPHRPSPIAVTGKPQKLPLFKPPSPSPPPPPHGELDPRTLFSPRPSGPSPPRSLLQLQGLIATIPAHQALPLPRNINEPPPFSPPPSPSTACPGEPLPPPPCSTPPPSSPRAQGENLTDSQSPSCAHLPCRGAFPWLGWAGPIG